MLRKIADKNLRKKLTSFGLSEIDLYKDDGYFFIESDDPLWADRITSLYSSSIYVNSYNQMTVNDWFLSIVDVLVGRASCSPRELEEEWQKEIYLKVYGE